MANPNRVELAVPNFTVNACDAILNGGEQRIETANLAAGEAHPVTLPPGDFVRLGVTVTGEGMPPEVLERLFEPFFTTEPQGNGIGLGLAQVYGTAKQLSGEVTVDSRVAYGTRVTLSLPRADVSTVHTDERPIESGECASMLD